MKIILVLSLLALLDSAYLLYNHYTRDTSFCNFGKTISCDIVNKSPYAEIFGIPTALLGLLYYLIMSVFAVAFIRRFDVQKIWHRLSPRLVMRLLVVTTVIGLAITLYLTYVELFVLMTICPFCVLQQAIIIAIFILLLPILFLMKNS